MHCYTLESEGLGRCQVSNHYLTDRAYKNAERPMKSKDEQLHQLFHLTFIWIDNGASAFVGRNLFSRAEAEYN